jgi:hypothetical protein
MAIIKMPRELSIFFKSNPAIQKFFEALSRTTPTTQAESDTKIIDDIEYPASSADGSMSMNAANNSVKIVLKTPGIYKGKIYRIDVIDSTNTCVVSGIINNTQQDFQIYVEESIIIQDNGSSWRVK